MQHICGSVCSLNELVLQLELSCTAFSRAHAKACVVIYLIVHCSVGLLGYLKED